MKERFKPLVGKVKLKCFHAYEGLNETSKMKSNSSSRESSPMNMKTPDMKSDSDGDSKDTGENSEDLYKSLLNEEPLTVPSSSQEKGTMTEPLIKKKNKCSSKLISAGFPNLHNAFDTISKSKADKVPAMILSKPSTESAIVSVGQDLVGLNTSQSKKLNTFKVTSSEQGNVAPSHGENSARKELPSILSSPGKGTSLGRENISLSSMPLLKSQAISQFKGFTTFKGKQQKFSISSIRSICVKGKKVKKNMFNTNLGEELGPKESERPNSEHPYSHATTPEKGRSVNISHPVTVEPPLTDTDYPHYVSRSVFGSPTSSKSPPDIMLHNDKINILRQMSQVFNDEKCKVLTKPEGIKTNPSPSSSSSENSNNSKKLPSDELDHSLKPVEKPTKTASATTTTVTTTSTSTTMAPSSVTTYSAPITPTTITPAPVLSVSKSSLENKCQTTHVECDVSKKLDEGLSPKNHVNPVIPKKYSTRNSTKEDGQASVIMPDVNQYKDKLEEPKNTPVHLVSSHSLEKEESIKVMSYIGSKGEDIDVIDGFTFFSFVSESEMISYSPSKSLKNLKQSKKHAKVKTPIKNTQQNSPSSTSSITADTPNTPAPDISMKMSNGINNQIPAKLTLSESASSQQCKGSTPSLVKPIAENTEVDQPDLDKTKLVQHSAFASNDLEQYLTEHAQLKISFPIPKCKATQGITKYDEEGNPIFPPDRPAVCIPSALTGNAPIMVHPIKAPNVSSSKKPPDSPAPPVAPLHPPSPPCLPVSALPIEQVPHSARLPPKESAPPPVAKVNGDSIFVKRRGRLLPLSSLTKRTDGSDIEGGCNKAVDMIYLYHAGRLLTLAGSLTKVSPTNCRAIRARVALPRGHGRLLKHSHKVQSRKVKAVEINADLAEFALSALKTPTKEEKPPVVVGPANPPKGQMDQDTKDGKYMKPSKENILDILTAKFSLDKDSKWDTPEKGAMEGCDLSSLSLDRSRTAGNLRSPLEGANNLSSGPAVPSKIMWTQDDILKKKVSTPLTEPSKALRKNINRFPSLSREMKRLNMNFVNCDKETESEKSDKSDDEVVEPCSNSFCALGCICESLKCRRRSPDHCGRAECMFGCSCTIESWKGSHRKGTPINVLSIFNADFEHQENVALKEKDFRKTIVQSGSDVFLIGGEKRKRDIKIPQRFKDSDFWTGPFAETPDSTSNNKENVPILPNAYKLHIKDFRLNVPWYDIEGASVWCMVHSCYDCYCLSDCDFYDTLSEEEDVSASSVPSAPPYLLPSPVITWKKGAQLDSSHFDDTLPRSPMESKIVQFILKLNPLDSSGATTCDRGKVTLKHWIHNGALFCARSCGYVVKNAVTKDMGHALKKGYSLPLPKYPFVMGITLKKTDGGEHIRKMSYDLGEGMSSRRKATFYDGLGPGLQLHPATPQTDDLFSRLVERGQYLSSIYLKSFEETEFRPSLSISASNSSTPPLSNVDSTTSIDQSSDLNRVPDVVEDSPCLDNPNTEGNHKTRQGISSASLGDFPNGDGEAKVCINSDRRSGEEVGGNGRDKTFSLSDMIREEEKRGELELDLTPKEQGKAILVTESRFRKLINMNIIGITGLNKAGRCTISTVKSSEDLVKMQRIQHLISNDLIDVGPNMRGIFTPSLQSEQRVRYVMIRYDTVGKWEIVGVVQRKQKEGSSPIILKPKRQKPSRIQPQLTKSSIVTGSKFVKNKPVLGSCTETTSETSGDAGKEEVTADVSSSLTDDSVRSDLAMSSKSTSEGLVLEKADENDQGLPCIASVHSHNDTDISNLLKSPPLITPYLPSPVALVDSQMQPEPFLKRTTPILTSFVLNQPSGKVFGGYTKNSGSKDGIVSSMDSTQTTLAFVPGDSIFRGSFKFNSTPVQTEANHPHSKIVLYPQPLLSPLVSAQPEPSTSRQQEKVKMLLVPSTTAPGKSLLIPAPSNDLPASYTLVLRKPDSESTPTMVCPPLSSPSSVGFFLEKKSTVPVSLLPPTLHKTFPIVHSSTSFTSPPATVAVQVSSPLVSTVFSSRHDTAIMAPGTPWNVPATFKMNIPHTAFPNLTASFNDASITDSSIALENSSGSSKDASITETSTALGKSSKDASITESSFALGKSSESSKDPSITESSLALGKSSGSSSTTAITLSHSSVSNQLNYTCSESSKGSISSPVAIEANDPTKIKQVSFSDANSPDVKCISVTNQNNCTAVDLSIRFKSIKLHWLSGTIKKELLLNIFKMSKKINSLISLSAKSECVQSSFLGMYRFCLDDEGNCYPILVLGTKPSSVLSLSRMTLREMFRSNTIKYLIRETTGELSTYTYDVKGVNLIKFGSKRRDMRSKIIGLGQKVPIELMREPSPFDTTFPVEMHTSSQSKQVNEEIVISDDSESEVLPVEKNQSSNTENEEQTIFDVPSQRPSRPILVSPLKAITTTTFDNQEETGSSGEMESLSLIQLPFAKCKRKLDHSLETNPAVTSREHFSATKKVKTVSSTPSHLQSLKPEISKMESLAVPVRKKPVLKIPNISNKLSISTVGATSHDSDQKDLLKSSHMLSPSKGSPPKIYPHSNSLRKNIDLSLNSPPSTVSLSQSVSPNSKSSSPTKPAILKVSPSSTSSLKYLPTKYKLKPPSMKAVQKPLVKWSAIKDSPFPGSTGFRTMKERPGKLLSELLKTSEVSLKGPIKNYDKSEVPKSLSIPSVNLANSSLAESCSAIDDMEMMSLPDTVMHSVGVTHVHESSLSPKDKSRKRVKTAVDVSSSADSRYASNLLCPPPMLSKMPMSEAGLPNYLKFKGMASIVEDNSNSNSTSSIQEENIDVEGDPDINIAELLHSQLRECISTSSVKSEKPCPLSKKRPQKQAKHAQNQKSSSSPKTANGSKKRTKTKSIHNTPSLIGQEFQQVFSSAPQFWLMDYTEKHNALERIRRKGLAKMLENLYAKTTESNLPITRLPAKHVVLKAAEKLIMSLRAKDVSLAKVEISLREKKTQLLNRLSDLLKDTDEEVQREFEHWISAHISNPTAKSKFEDSWKPPKVTFEDEHIMTTSCGQLTVSGTDITSYFATHTAGFTHCRGMPKSRGVVSKAQQMARKKYMFPMVSGSKHHLHPHQSHAPKSKLSHLIKSSPFPSLKGSIAQNAVGCTLVASGGNARDDAALDEGHEEGDAIDRTREDDVVLHTSSTPNDPSDGQKGGSTDVSLRDDKKRKTTFHNERSAHLEQEVETTLDDSYEALPSMHWFQRQSIHTCKEISNDASCSSRLSVTSDDSGDELKLSSTSESSPSSG